MMRVSIRPYLQDWINQIGQQLGCEDDPTETVNHLLRECKRILGQQPTVTAATKTANQPQSSDDLTDVLSSEFEF
jgi:hypothetical protein